jgi:NADH:ubiquinone oxidoreductase subunit E
MTKEELDSIIERRGTDSPALVGILQEIQEKEHCLPLDTLQLISERLGISLSRLYGIATFFKGFTLKPVGEHTIEICLGTTCYVRGGAHLMTESQHLLHVKEDATTSDKKFTLKSVRCLGCCALAPVIRVDDLVYRTVSTRELPEIISKYREG